MLLFSRDDGLRRTEAAAGSGACWHNGIRFEYLDLVVATSDPIRSFINRLLPSDGNRKAERTSCSSCSLLSAPSPLQEGLSC